jgi:hypothetical protein
VFIDRHAADEVAGGCELRRVALLVEEAQNAFDLGHHFDADAVAGKQQELMRGHGGSVLS